MTIIFGGACNCEEDPDPDPDVIDNDVEEDVDDPDDVVEPDDVEEDVEEDVVDDVVDDPIDIPEGMARIQVVHNAADPAAESIDVYLDDDLTIDDFEFRTATPYLDVDAQEYDVSIAGDDSDSVDDAIATFEQVELEERQRYLIVANGLLESADFDDNPDGQDTDLALYVFDNAREVSDDDNTDDMVVFHGATDAPGVDLVADNDSTVVSGLEYGQFTQGYLSLPTGITVFDLLVADTDDRVDSFQTPSLGGGDAYVALASGFLDEAQNPDAPFEIVVYPTPVDGERLEAIVLDRAARLQLVHDSIDPAASPADIYADDTRIGESVEFREATPFLTFPSGQPIEFGITEADADSPDDPVIAETIEFAPADQWLAVASGVTEPGDYPDNPDGIDTELDLYSYDGAREVGEVGEDADILPFHSIIDAPAIEADIEADGDVITVADALDYGEFGDYTAVPGDETAILSLFENPGPLVAEFTFDTEAFGEEAALLVVSGLLDADPAEDEPTPAVVIVGADGETTVVDPD